MSGNHAGKPIVFVSATSGDLAEQRALVADLLESAGLVSDHQPTFGVSARELTQMLQEKVLHCSAVICLIGKRFGAYPAQQDAIPLRSYTQIEYDAARLSGRPTYVFMTPDDSSESDEPLDVRKWQARHRSEVLNTHPSLVMSFRNNDDLAVLVQAAIDEIKRGSVRRPLRLINWKSTAANFTGRDWEQSQLRRALLEPKRPCVTTVYGSGGQGKSSFTHHVVCALEGSVLFDGLFLATLEVGSFEFSQILEEALAYVHQCEPRFLRFTNDDDRVRALLKAMQNERLLLVLDGVECCLHGWRKPQSSSSALSVESRTAENAALTRFLEESAAITNGSHLVITTRAIPAALDGRQVSFVPVDDSGRPNELGGLCMEDARMMLRQMGVRGSDQALDSLANAWGCHPMALEIGGALIVERFGGVVQSWPRHDLLDASSRLATLLDQARAHLPGGKAAEYLITLVAQFDEAAPLDLLMQLDERLSFSTRLLRLLGSAFPWIRIEEHRAAKEDHSRRESMINMVMTLHKWRMVNWDGDKNRVSLHPLVKTHFRKRIRHASIANTTLAILYSREEPDASASDLSAIKGRLLALHHAIIAKQSALAIAIWGSSCGKSPDMPSWFAANGHVTEGERLLMEFRLIVSDEWKARLAISLGAFQRQLGKHEMALKTLDEAIQWLEAHAHNVAELAAAFLNRGNVKREIWVRGAESDYNRAVALLSTEKRHARSLARALTNRGAEWSDIGMLSQAKADMESALSILARLNPLHPDNIMEWALAKSGLGNILADRYEWEAALAQHNEAVDLLTQFKEPLSHDRSSALLEALALRANTWHGLRRWEEGVEDCEKARALIRQEMPASGGQAQLQSALLCLTYTRNLLAAGRLQEVLPLARTNLQTLRELCATSSNDTRMWLNAGIFHYLQALPRQDCQDEIIALWKEASTNSLNLMREKRGLRGSWAALIAHGAQVVLNFSLMLPELALEAASLVCSATDEFTSWDEHRLVENAPRAAKAVLDYTFDKVKIPLTAEGFDWPKTSRLQSLARSDAI